MIDLLQFGDALATNAQQSQASIVYKEDNIWHKLYISKSTNAKENPYTKLQILDRISTLDIFQGVILDYCVIGKDQGVYVKLKHLESKIQAFSKQHILVYENLECFCLDYLDKHYYHTLQSAPLRFNDFTDTNIFLQDDLSWRNVDVEDYFNNRYFPPVEYFASRTWTTMMQIFDNDSDVDVAKQVFDTFYNQKRLNTVEQTYKDITKNW